MILNGLHRFRLEVCGWSIKCTGGYHQVPTLALFHAFARVMWEVAMTVPNAVAMRAGCLPPPSWKGDWRNEKHIQEAGAYRGWIDAAPLIPERKPMHRPPEDLLEPSTPPRKDKPALSRSPTSVMGLWGVDSGSACYPGDGGAAEGKDEAVNDLADDLPTFLDAGSPVALRAADGPAKPTPSARRSIAFPPALRLRGCGPINRFGHMDPIAETHASADDLLDDAWMAGLVDGLLDEA